MSDIIQLAKQTPSNQASDPMHNLACRIISDGEFLITYCFDDEKFYKYSEGVWKIIKEVKLLAELAFMLPILNTYAVATRKNVLENLKIVKHIPLEELNNTCMLNLTNGMLNAETGEFSGHEPDYYSTIQLTYEYNQEAKCDLWIKSINEILEDDQENIGLLQEFFGYCLVPDVKQKKALLLLGDSDSGKSTVLNILRAMLGKENCSSVPLKYLPNPQYTPMLVNKLCNIDADVAKDAQAYEAEFKIITSGEPVTANQKFVATFEFIPKCRIVLAANEFPKITDHSSAFYKRLLLIPFNRIFAESEKNNRLASQLMEELPGILNWSLEGLKRLTERGIFSQSESMRDAVQELEDENNPSNLFMEEHIEISFGEEIEKNYLFEKYKNWCEVTKNYTLSQSRFGMAVYKRFHKETPKDSKKSEGNRKRIWKNLRYVEFKTSNAPNLGWSE